MPEDFKTYRRRSSVVSRTVDGRAVLVVMGGETLHSLNQTGTRLWDDCCSGEFDPDSLAQELVQRYEVRLESARADVSRFLSSLIEVGVIEEVGP